MSSINTNVAAMTALQSLTQTNKMLTQTQSHISTGLRVAEASDNAAYWSIATTMRSDKASLSTVQDALGLGASMVDVAYTAMNSAIDVVNSDQEQAGGGARAWRRQGQGADRDHAAAEAADEHRRLGLVLRPELAVGRTRAPPASTRPRASSRRSRAPAAPSPSRPSTSIRRAMDLFDANAAATNAGAGILDATATRPAPSTTRPRPGRSPTSTSPR